MAKEKPENKKTEGQTEEQTAIRKEIRKEWIQMGIDGCRVVNPEGNHGCSDQKDLKI